MNLIEVYHDTVSKTKTEKNIFTTKHNISLNISEKKNYNKDCKIFVINEDCIQIAIDSINSQNYPLLLNLADDKIPGGCVHSGSRTQEEHIFRVSNLWKFIGDYKYNLKSWEKFYPLKNSDCLYSKNVSLIKDGKYSDFPERYISILTMPAINQPKLENGKFNQSDFLLMKQKIQTIFKVAIYYNHNCLILGALGCGVWLCPNKEVAEIFKEEIENFKGYFDYIIFAIKSSSDSNYSVFKQILTPS